MNKFQLILMYSDKHGMDMWFVERVEEVYGEDDYFGPFLDKEVAQIKLDSLNEVE